MVFAEIWSICFRYRFCQKRFGDWYTIATCNFYNTTTEFTTHFPEILLWIPLFNIEDIVVDHYNAFVSIKYFLSAHNLGYGIVNSLSWSKICFTSDISLDNEFIHIIFVHQYCTRFIYALFFKKSYNKKVTHTIEFSGD